MRSRKAAFAGFEQQKRVGRVAEAEQEYYGEKALSLTPSFKALKDIRASAGAEALLSRTKKTIAIPMTAGIIE